MHSHKVSPVYIQGSQFISMHLKVYPGILVGFQGISRYPKVSQGISRYPQGFLHGFIHPKVSQGISRYLKVSPGIPRIHPRIHPSQGISRYLQVSPGIPRILQEFEGICRIHPGIPRYFQDTSSDPKVYQGISRMPPWMPWYFQDTYRLVQEEFLRLCKSKCGLDTKRWTLGEIHGPMTCITSLTEYDTVLNMCLFEGLLSLFRYPHNVCVHMWRLYIELKVLPVCG